MRAKLVLAISLFASALSAHAWAQNAHFLKGPTVKTTADSVCVSGRVAGLGNSDLQVAIEISAVATTNCVNHGGNVAPGQGTVTATKTTSASFKPDKNGSLTFALCGTVSPADFPTPTPEQAGCPNGNWTVAPIAAEDITITSYEITISHDGTVLYHAP